MNFASVIRIQCMLGLGLAAAMAPALLVAIALGERPQMIAFAITAVLLSLVAGSLLLMAAKPKRRAMPSDGLAACLLGWILVGVVAAPPFVIGVANDSITAAMHEAFSCLTTTGHTVVAIGDGGWPVSLIVWRGLLHVIGAIFTLTMAASVFAAMNLGGPGIHRTELFTIPEGSFFSAVPRVLIAVTIFILSLIASFAILLVFFGTPGGQAMMDAVSAITTGQVDPTGSSTLFSFSRSVIVSIALIFGTLGLYVGLQLRRMRFRDCLNDPEVLAFLAVMAGFTTLAIMAGLSPWEGGAWSLSAISTSGMPIVETDLNALLPLSLLVLPAIIGGSALSAAGGMKLGRLVILVRRAAQEFGSLGYRGSMLKFVYRGRALDESTVIGVWVYLIGYVIAIVGFIWIFSFSGHAFDVTVMTAIGAVTNSGALVHPDIVTGDLNLMMIFAMLLGRWEILALLPAFSPAFWRR